MEYIVTKRFKTECICGEVNLPYGTECKSRGGIISHNDKQICVATSENAKVYFTANYDGKGKERRKIIDEIQSLLHNNQENWDKVWESEYCQQYKRTDHKTHWLWNDEFYWASLDSLNKILEIIKK